MIIKPPYNNLVCVITYIDMHTGCGTHDNQPRALHTITHSTQKQQQQVMITYSLTFFFWSEQLILELLG